MLTLPPLEIERNELREVEVYEKIRKWLEVKDTTRTPGIHATDLLDPRLACWKKIKPKPLTERQVWFFTIGQILHMLVLTAWADNPTFASDAGTHEELNISFSPDGEIDGHPIELKSSRARSEPREGRLQEEQSHYFEQLAVYQVLSNKLEGELWILYLSLQDATRRTFPGLRCYTVSMTEEEFYELEQEIITIRDRLEKAITAKNPSLLPLCRAWLCNKGNCSYWDECRPSGRWPETNRKLWTA